MLVRESSCLGGGGGWQLTGQVQVGSFWGDGNVLYLVLGGGYSAYTVNK